MASSERPVDGTGPLVDLARALRLVREQAGNPGYRELSAKTLYSRETLSAAARGGRVPYLGRGEGLRQHLRPDRGRRTPDMAPVGEGQPAWAPPPGRVAPPGGRRPTASSGLPPTGPLGFMVGHLGRTRRVPRPSTPGSYAPCAPGPTPGGRRSGPGGISRRAPCTTRYDPAASPCWARNRPGDRQRLHRRRQLQGEAEEWTDAWRAIALRDFTGANPQPAARPPEASWPPTRVARLIRPESVPSPRSGAVGSEALPA